MTSGSPRNTLVRFSPNPPASRSFIDRCLTKLICPLPADYIGFLQWANGGEGFIDKTYLILWRVEELMDMNSAYQVAEFAPGILIFGSYGGGESFAFDMRATPVSIVSIPFIALELEDAIVVAPSFDAFLENLSSS